MPETAPLYPLLFEPIYKEKVWGGRALARLGRDLPGDRDTAIGESWELVDLATTSASGGGGAAEHSVVATGPLAGKTINQLIAQFGRGITGETSADTSPAFPLLIKYLDANDNLSVQVHPSPEYAAAHREAHLKSEAWYVVDCAPDAVIYKDLMPGVTEPQLRAALEANTDDAVVPLLRAVPVKPGDCHYLPSGTCHALGAGVLVAEVQTPSDTTFRVYDWGRTGRELHVEQAMACIDFDHPGDDPPNAWERNTVRAEPKALYTNLVACPYFEIERVDAEAGYETTVQPDRPEVWMVLQGVLALATTDGPATRATQGSTLLLPPGAGRVDLSAEAGSQWLRVTLASN
ncbi:MAG: type I phosphomannose isomerase catalytic subunit [Phycisphaerales bacterium JB063]